MKPSCPSALLNHGGARNSCVRAIAANPLTSQDAWLNAPSLQTRTSCCHRAGIQSLRMRMPNSPVADEALKSRRAFVVAVNRPRIPCEMLCHTVGAALANSFSLMDIGYQPFSPTGTMRIHPDECSSLHNDSAFRSSMVATDKIAFEQRYPSPLALSPHTDTTNATELP